MQFAGGSRRRECRGGSHLGQWPRSFPTFSLSAFGGLNIGESHRKIQVPG